MPDLNTPSMTAKTDLLNHKVEQLFASYLRIDRHQITHRRFDGSTSGELTREVLERGHVSAVLPVDIERRRVVLIEQFRPGAQAAGWEPWLLECVAGIIETGETSADVAARETREEAGCDILSLISVAKFLTSPGACSETVHLYAAAINSEGVGGIHGLAEEGEDIKVHTVSFESAFELLAAGRIVNAKTLIALQWLQLNEANLSHLFSPENAGAA